MWPGLWKASPLWSHEIAHRLCCLVRWLRCLSWRRGRRGDFGELKLQLELTNFEFVCLFNKRQSLEVAWGIVENGPLWRLPLFFERRLGFGGFYVFHCFHLRVSVVEKVFAGRGKGQQLCCLRWWPQRGWICRGAFLLAKKIVACWKFDVWKALPIVVGGAMFSTVAGFPYGLVSRHNKRWKVTTMTKRKANLLSTENIRRGNMRPMWWNRSSE